MKSYKYKAGVTLIETLIVVAVIALLVSTVIRVATRIDNQSSERLTESTIAILTAALEEFGDYGYNYNNSVVDYSGFDFPLDCNGFNTDELQTTLGNALGLAAGSVLISGGTHEDRYSGSEVLYFFLSRVPENRKTLDKIDSSLITNIGSDGSRMNIAIGSNKVYPLLRIIDPWGTTLRYDYYVDWVDWQATSGGSRPEYLNYIEDNKKTFPVITSAGPDRRFGTVDDISNRK